MADIETPSVARWSERFVAFLIDVVIISVIGTVIGGGSAVRWRDQHGRE